MTPAVYASGKEIDNNPILAIKISALFLFLSPINNRIIKIIKPNPNIKGPNNINKPAKTFPPVFNLQPD